jgi:RNA polymerase sigma-70 factor (ECF subfamily)
MDEADSIPDLVGRLREGDPRAAEQLVAAYAQRLTRLAEQHLSRRLAGRLDGEDVVQSVFRTFFRRSAQREFQIDSSDAIWHLLAKITLLKARAKGRHHSAEKRDVRAETPHGSDAWLYEAMAQGPAPSAAWAARSKEATSRATSARPMDEYCTSWPARSMPPRCCARPAGSSKHGR